MTQKVERLFWVDCGTAERPLSGREYLALGNVAVIDALPQSIGFSLRYCCSRNFICAWLLIAAMAPPIKIFNKIKQL